MSKINNKDTKVLSTAIKNLYKKYGEMNYTIEGIFSYLIEEKFSVKLTKSNMISMLHKLQSKDFDVKITNKMVKISTKF